MIIKSIVTKSSKFLRLLKPINPKPQSRYLHLSTEKPSFLSKIKQPKKQQSPSLESSSSSLTQISDILKSNNHESWKSNDQLTLSIPSLTSDDLLEITRNLGDSSIALHFIEHLRENSNCPDEKTMSSVFQAAFELATREDECGERVLELYEKSKEFKIGLNVNSVTHLIRRLSIAKMIDKSVMIYDELDTQLKNVHVRNVMIDGLIRSRRFDHALKLLDEMLQPNFEFPPDGYTSVIVYGALFNHTKQLSMKEFLKRISQVASRGLFPDSVTLTKLIVELCSSKRVNKAWGLLHTLLEGGCPVGVSSWNALLKGLERSREFDQMNLLMKEMLEKGVSPNVVTMGICINHLCKSLRVDEAVDLFDKMVRGEISDGLKPDVILYNTLIDGLCKAGRVDDGLSLMRKMTLEDGCSPNQSTYTCLIDGFSKAREIEKSLELFDEMMKAGVEPSIRTINSLISGFCRHGKAGSALKFYREMQDKGLVGTTVTYTALISGFCGVNNIRKAMELLDEMRERQCKPDAVLYYTLISGLSQAGLMDEVESMLSEMRSAGFRPDIGCYNVMINGFCQKNKLDKARQLLRDLVEDGLKPDSFTYNPLISYFSQIGDVKTSLVLLKQMIKDKVSPTVVTYGTLIHACCTAGEQDEALKILKQMRSSAKVRPNTVIYNTLIDSLCRNKNLKLALSLFNEMLDMDVKPSTNTFNALFKALREDNWLERAYELMDTMIVQNCSPDYITLEVLTQWLSAVGAAERLKLFVKAYTDSPSSSENPAVLTTN